MVGVTHTGYQQTTLERTWDSSRLINLRKPKYHIPGPLTGTTNLSQISKDHCQVFLLISQYVTPKARTTAAAPTGLLVGCWVGQSLELGAVGAVIGAGRTAQSRKSIYLLVAIAVPAILISTILLQIAGWAPAMKTISTG